MLISDYHSSFRKIVFEFILTILLFVIFCLVSSLLFFIYKFVIKLELIFIHNRIGLNGEMFVVYKYYSMPSANISGHIPSRVFGIVSKILRSSHIDELPQVVNILKGNMNVIGPRPFMVQESREFQSSLNNFHIRHNVKPGITGLAQINYDHENTMESGSEKLRDDLHYVENANLRLDMKIVMYQKKHLGVF